MGVKDLNGKSAIVTGAGAGFGAAIAHRFARMGARVVVADINAKAAEAVAEAIGEQAMAIEADVASADSIGRMIELAAGRFGPPNIVVNNAGTTHDNMPVLDIDEAAFDRCFDINVKSIFHMVRATVPLMAQNGGGAIINIGSTAGIRPRPGLVWYNASKGAVNLLSRSLAIELAPINVRVNVICPVLAATAMLPHFLGNADTPENRAKFVGTIPLGRFCDPEDVADAAAYLATAEFVTGIELPVDGGRTA